MIALDGVFAREGSLELQGVSLRHERGALAIVGGAQDGGGLLLRVAAGFVRARRGRVERPADAEIAWVPLAPQLPEGLLGRELLELAASQRREPPRALERLRAFGLESLAARDTRDLDPAEARALLCCEALTSTRARLALLEEPLATNVAAGRIEAALRAREGATLIATASPRDARALAGASIVLRQGRALAQGSTLDPLMVVGPRGARLVAVVSDPRALAGACDVERIEIRGRELVLIGEEPRALAAALQRALAGVKVTVESVTLEPLELAPLQAAATAEATLAYQAALDRARAVPQPGPRA